MIKLDFYKTLFTILPIETSAYLKCVKSSVNLKLKMKSATLHINKSNYPPRRNAVMHVNSQMEGSYVL
jgi:hypothetical protein